MPFQIFTFTSTHHVLKAEKLLISAGIKLEIIPTPKNISSDCGMSIRINPEVSNLVAIETILIENEIHFEMTMQT